MKTVMVKLREEGGKITGSLTSPDGAGPLDVVKAAFACLEYTVAGLKKSGGMNEFACTAEGSLILNAYLSLCKVYSGGAAPTKQRTGESREVNTLAPKGIN